MSEYARATGDREALECALQLFDSIEEHAFDHEYNGYIEACTREWGMLEDKLNTDGFDNLVWSYSPGMQDDLTAKRLLDRYPGDDRVDMIGLDGYQWQPEEKEMFMERSKQNLTVLCQVAQEHGLIPALTECGMKCMTEPTWWTSTLLPVVKEFIQKSISMSIWSFVIVLTNRW